MGKHHKLLSKRNYLIISSLIVIAIYCYQRFRQPTSIDFLDASQDVECSLDYVIDGDSIKANCQQQLVEIRLQHIDAPELAQEPWGKQSRLALQELLPQQFFVDFQGKDVYFRYLGVIYVDDISINQTLVGQGYARIYVHYQPPKGYKAAMKSAQKQRLGIWSAEGLHQDPQRFRRLSP